MAMSLWEARGRIREVVPRPAPMVDGFINRRIRNVIDVRNWSDLVKIGMIVIPNAYTTGTASLVSGSNLVAGTSTAWPTNDAINTVSTQPILDTPEFVEIFPGAGFIQKIVPGSILLIDQEDASYTEIITVQSVGPDRFIAYCQFPHAANVTLKQSSLAGMQFWANNYVYTVQAVLSPTSLQLDMAYGGLPMTNIAYQIRQQYVTISATARKLMDAWDSIAGQSVGVLRDESWLNLTDPQRTNTGNPLELAMMHPAPGGVLQWECWPAQIVAYAIAVLYKDGWPTLKYDTDVLPPFMNSEIFISGAIADCMLTKVLRNDRSKDDFYDPTGAQHWQGEYRETLENAIQSDEGRAMRYLTNWYEMTKGGQSYNWYRGQASYQPSPWGGGSYGGW
jgi:hypothetical protein